MVLDAGTCVGAYNLPGRFEMAPTSLILHAVSVQAPGSRGIAQMAQRLPFFLFSPEEGELQLCLAFLLLIPAPAKLAGAQL